MAVWLGGFFLIAVLLGLRLPLPAFKWSDSASLGTIANSAVVGQLAVICVIYLVTSLPGAVALGANARRYVTGFPFVFLLAWLAQVAAGNATANYWGIEYVIFALILGLFVSNVIGVPVWLQEAVRTEYYIKTGLVIMGATILFQEIMTAGALGMLQALAVVIVIWYLISGSRSGCASTMSSERSSPRLYPSAAYRPPSQRAVLYKAIGGSSATSRP